MGHLTPSAAVIAHRTPALSTCTAPFQAFLPVLGALFKALCVHTLRHMPTCSVLRRGSVPALDDVIPLLITAIDV